MFSRLIFGTNRKQQASRRRQLWMQNYANTDVLGSCWLCNNVIHYNKTVAQGKGLHHYELAHIVSLEEANRKRWYPSWWFFDPYALNNLHICCNTCNRHCSKTHLYVWALCNLSPHRLSPPALQTILGYLTRYPFFLQEYLAKNTSVKTQLKKWYRYHKNERIVTRLLI